MISDSDKKIAVAFKAGRAAAGLSQVRFAEEIGVAKSTIARIETNEIAPRGSLLLDAIKLFSNYGVYVDIGDNVVVTAKFNEGK